MKIILHHFRFNSDIDSLTGYKTKTMMCSPIKDQQGAVIGVAQVMMDFGIIFHLIPQIFSFFIGKWNRIRLSFVTNKCNYFWEFLVHIKISGYQQEQ